MRGYKKKRQLRWGTSGRQRKKRIRPVLKKLEKQRRFLSEVQLDR